MKTADDIAQDVQRQRDRLHNEAAQLRGAMEDAARRLQGVEAELVEVERLYKALGPPAIIGTALEGVVFGGSAPAADAIRAAEREIRLNVQTAGPPPVKGSLKDYVPRYVTQEG